ncbi:MAG: hypothetical protein R8J85_05250 [Mariprofundales bacterium]
MATISLRLPDRLLDEISFLSKEMHIPRTEYIRKSLINMNHQTALIMRQKQLMAASKRVQEQSIAINREFDAIEYDES